MPEIRITDSGVEKRIIDIAPYVAEARRIEDELYEATKAATGNLAALRPQLARLRKLDARRLELQAIFDRWNGANDDEYMAELSQRVAAVIAGRGS